MRNPIPAREQEAALALLRQQNPAAPFPGAATGRLHGRFATLAVTGIAATLLCFHWELEFSQEFADATAHGDYWRVRIPLTQDWQARVQGYMTRAAATYLAAVAPAAQGVASLTGDPAAMTLTLYNDAGVNVIFTGTCYAQRGRVLAPQAMVTQELELVAAQVPTVMT